jgi:hypothetical protein
MRSRKMSADDKLPAEINAMFYPSAAAFPWLVVAVSPLSHDAFEKPLSDGG